MASEGNLVKIILELTVGVSLNPNHEVVTSGNVDLSAINSWLQRHPPQEFYALFGSTREPGKHFYVAEKSAGLDRFIVMTHIVTTIEAQRLLDELNQMEIIKKAYIEGTTEHTVE